MSSPRNKRAKTIAVSAAHEPPEPGAYFDELAAQSAEEFFDRYVTHVKGELKGRPLRLEPWQRHSTVRPIFGWKRADGSRLVRTCYKEIPRKNGKSTEAAGIALLLTFGDAEPGAEVYSAAADREQAAIVFDAARAMVEASPALRKRARVYRRAIEVPRTGSVYRVISADAYTKHGLHAHGIIFDELHAQPDRELWDVLTTSTGARRQPLVFAITTAGTYSPSSICWEQHDYALKVRDGIITDPSFLPVVYAAGPEDDFRLESTWRKANPNLAVSVKLDYLAREARRAQEVPGYENTFRRLHLNQWTQQATRWLPMDSWDACNFAPIDLDALRGRPCYGGLDLSTTTDLTAFALFFPSRSAGEKPLLKVLYWTPQDTITRRAKRDRVPYDRWAADGHLTATPGNVIDYDRIRGRVRELGELLDIREIGFDPWNATQLAVQLGDDGFVMVAMRQGIPTLGPGTREIERLIVDRALNHGGDPVTRWCASNVAVKSDDNGNMKPDKAKSGDRIDGIVAAAMAIGRAISHAQHQDSFSLTVV